MDAFFGCCLISFRIRHTKKLPILLTNVLKHYCGFYFHEWTPFPPQWHYYTDSLHKNITETQPKTIIQWHHTSRSDNSDNTKTELSTHCTLVQLSSSHWSGRYDMSSCQNHKDVLLLFEYERTSSGWVCDMTGNHKRFQVFTVNN